MFPDAESDPEKIAAMRTLIDKLTAAGWITKSISTQAEETSPSFHAASYTDEAKAAFLRLHEIVSGIENSSSSLSRDELFCLKHFSEAVAKAQEGDAGPHSNRFAR